MKKCLRQKCQKEFEPNKPKQIFCSAKCRVYFSRENKTELDNRDNKLINAARGRDATGINKDEIEGNKFQKMADKIVQNEIPRLKGESSIEYRLRMIELSEQKNKK